MSRLSSALRFLLVGGLLCGLLGVGAIAAVVAYFVPSLPSISALRDIQLQTPLRVLTRDGRLIAEFGEQRRNPVDLDQVPELLVQAVIASEDERFYDHPGVDWQGIVRAVMYRLRTGEFGPGGSTLTMQVARNFFLGREKTLTRKFKEILLALKIERELGKDEILELYFNKIFFGHRAYGVGAAAQVYYGGDLDELDLAQLAMIAGLPKAPSRVNPIVNPAGALIRRNYVLGRMREVGYVDEPTYQGARSRPVTAKLHGLEAEVEAPYVAEMVRAALEARMGSEAYIGGYRVFTTLDSARQQAANAALRRGLLAYDQRHGYRGPELHVELETLAGDYEAALADIPVIGGLPPAIVLVADETVITAHAKGFGVVEVLWESLQWARPYISQDRRGPKPQSPLDVVQPGDVVRVQLTEEGWSIVQVPAVEGAFVALDPNDGAILVLAGGFDFYRSKFNRAVQAQRQPGSSFKPFIYSAALANGFTPASFINDAPVVFEDVGLEDMWRPENYSGKFFGPTRLRVALYKSRNLVSIRLLNAMGIENALTHIRRFGLDVSRLPTNLSLAVGSGEVTPLELATGYSVLANGGYRVEPYFIHRIETADGGLIEQVTPRRVCRECLTPAQVPPPTVPVADVVANAVVPATPDSIGGGFVELVAPTVAAAESNQESLETSTGLPPDVTSPDPSNPSKPPKNPEVHVDVDTATDDAPVNAERTVDGRNIWIMNSMMRDVVRLGTARRALQLGRKDLAGKTGTTNDFRDAWFSGFTPNLVATVWVGFDQHQSLGRREAGSRAALPIWIDFMRRALDGVPEEILDQPEGLVTIRISPHTGEPALASDPDAVFETFLAELVPDRTTAKARDTGPEVLEEEISEQLF